MVVDDEDGDQVKLAVELVEGDRDQVKLVEEELVVEELIWFVLEYVCVYVCGLCVYFAINTLPLNKDLEFIAILLRRNLN